MVNDTSDFVSHSCDRFGGSELRPEAAKTGAQYRFASQQRVGGQAKRLRHAASIFPGFDVQDLAAADFRLRTELQPTGKRRSTAERTQIGSYFRQEHLQEL